jgi:hypothetical protein
MRHEDRDRIRSTGARAHHASVLLLGAVVSELHFHELVELTIGAGLADTDDVSDWLKERGVCLPAIDQYGSAIIDAAEASDDDGRAMLEGIFLSGLTLGMLIGGAR